MALFKTIKLKFRKTKKIHKTWTSTEEDDDDDEVDYDPGQVALILREERRLEKIEFARQRREIRQRQQSRLPDVPSAPVVDLADYALTDNDFADNALADNDFAGHNDLADTNEQNEELMAVDDMATSENPLAENLDYVEAAEGDQQADQPGDEQQEQQGDEEPDGDQQVPERDSNCEVQKLITKPLQYRARAANFYVKMSIENLISSLHRYSIQAGLMFFPYL